MIPCNENIACPEVSVHAYSTPKYKRYHRNIRNRRESHDISPFNGGNRDGIYGAAGFLYHMQIIPNWK